MCLIRSRDRDIMKRDPVPLTLIAFDATNLFFKLYFKI
jgi:hypothetical protein